MSESRTMTMRDYALKRASEEWHTVMGGGRILHLELVSGHGPTDQVLRYGARALGKGQVRVGIIHSVPDEYGSYFHGADIAVTDVPRWFSVRGVPVVRVSNRPVF